MTCQSEFKKSYLFGNWNDKKIILCQNLPTKRAKPKPQRRGQNHDRNSSQDLGDSPFWITAAGWLACRSPVTNQLGSQAERNEIPAEQGFCRFFVWNWLVKWQNFDISDVTWRWNMDLLKQYFVVDMVILNCHVRLPGDYPAEVHSKKKKCF